MEESARVKMGREVQRPKHERHWCLTVLVECVIMLDLESRTWDMGKGGRVFSTRVA